MPLAMPAPALLLLPLALLGWWLRAAVAVLEHPVHRRFHVQTSMRHLGIEPHILWNKLLEAHPDPRNAMIVEVGSYDGSQCVQAAKAGYGRVICLEPSPRSFERCKAAVDAGGPYLDYQKVSMLQLAGSNVTGEEVEFHSLGDQRDHAGPVIKGERGLFSGPPVMVKTQALDDLLRDETLDFWMLKIDTQGFDGMVIKGAQETLHRANRPQNIQMELWPVAMNRTVPCTTALRDVLVHGYKAYEMPVCSHIDMKPTKEQVFNRPTSVTELCKWYEEHPNYRDNPYGYYTDIWFTDAPRAPRGYMT